MMLSAPRVTDRKCDARGWGVMALQGLLAESPWADNLVRDRLLGGRRSGFAALPTNAPQQPLLTSRKTRDVNRIPPNRVGVKTPRRRFCSSRGAVCPRRPVRVARGGTTGELLLPAAFASYRCLCPTVLRFQKISHRRRTPSPRRARAPAHGKSAGGCRQMTNDKARMANE